MSNQENSQVSANLDDELYKFILDFSNTIYENGMYREQSLIQQATNMQTAFSFVTAAVFMAAAIIIEYRGTLTLNYLLLVFSSISISLVLSLFFATMAQNRRNQALPPKISTVSEYLSSNKEKLQTPKERYEYQIQTLAKVSDTLDENNDKRVTWIKRSMFLFYLSLFLCVLWFLVTIIKIL